MPKYEVPIVYHGQDTYIVEANSPQEAEAIARAKFNDGDTPEPLGNEWEILDHIGEITLLPTDSPLNPSE